MAVNYFKTRHYTPIQQYAAFRQKFPEWEVVWKQHGFEAKGYLRPSPLSESYHICITYYQGKAPKVTVISPQLRPREKGGEIKHTYSDGSLCLYYPKAREWTPAQLISNTLVEWAALWLYHYETWHAIGDWLGGGVEH